MLAFGKGIKATGILLLAVAMSGCMSAQSGSSSESAIGAFAGTSTASAGQASAAALVEALRGGLIAKDIGNDLRSDERRMALAAEYQALEYAPVGQPVTWRGSNGRVSGQVSAAAPYRVGSQNCRQYVHTVRSGDSERTARGTACREADGRWSLLV